MTEIKDTRFKPGNQLSVGRPKGITEMRAMAKQYTEEMLYTLVDIARDRDERGSVRVAAAELVLTRAWGKADSYQDKPTGEGLNVTEISTAELTAMLIEAKVQQASEPVLLEHAEGSEADEQACIC